MKLDTYSGMNLRALIFPVSILTFGCNSGLAEGGDPPAGDECAADETLVVDPETGEEVCSSGFTEGTTVVPSEDFAECGESAPNSSCSLEDFCAIEGCGTDGSMFDANGCRRKLCSEDADCDSGQICYTTNSDTDGCLSTADYACAPIDGEPCSCIADLICGEESHCIDQ